MQLSSDLVTRNKAKLSTRFTGIGTSVVGMTPGSPMTQTLVGIPLFVWTSTRLFGSLRAALCEVFDTEETRSWPIGKATDVALVLIAGLLFVGNTAASEGVAVLAQRGDRPGILAFFGSQLLAFVFVLLLFLVVFRYAPARRVRTDTAFVAALICAVGFEAAKPALGWVFAHWLRPDQLVSDTTLGALLVDVDPVSLF